MIKQYLYWEVNFALDESSDIKRLLKKYNYRIFELPKGKNWQDIMERKQGKLFINCYPAGKYGMETQARRLGRECLYLPGSFDYDEIEEQLKKLTDTLGLPELTEDERKQERQSCEQALAKAKDLIKDMPITLVIYTIQDLLDWQNCSLPMVFV